MFIDEVQDIVRRTTCVSIEENCQFMKGKLVAGEHVPRNAVHKERFYVNYDEYIEDIPQNRVQGPHSCFVLSYHGGSLTGRGLGNTCLFWMG